MLKSAVLNKICSFACGLIAGVVFSVVILEAALRMGGWLTTFLREGRENLLLQDRERCRIVCLGDSSTIAGADESYPSQLERMLNDSAAGMKFTVINKGEPAVTTKHILSRIEGIIEEYEPNIVVAMMGGNDKEDMYAGSDHRRKLPALHKLRVYKLIMFWRADIKRKMSVKAGGGAADVNRYIGLSGYYAAANDYDNAEKVLKKAVDLFPGAARPYIELGRLYAMTGKYEMAEAAYSRALYINYGDDYVFGMLGALYMQKGEGAAAREYFRRAEELRSNIYNPETAANYLKLKYILEKKGIKLVCVQYPLRSIVPLKKIFNNHAYVVFVDNEKSFEDAVERDGYGRYFADRYQGDYGHCTREGNHMLAGNVASAIRKAFLDGNLQKP